MASAERGGAHSGRLRAEPQWEAMGACPEAEVFSAFCVPKGSRKFAP